MAPWRMETSGVVAVLVFAVELVPDFLDAQPVKTLVLTMLTVRRHKSARYPGLILWISSAIVVTKRVGTIY